MSKIFSFLSLPLLCAATAFGQAYTTPVGAVTTELQPGTKLAITPFQTPKEFQGALTAVTGSTLTFGSELGALSSGSHYVQVVSGAAVGTIASVQSVTGASLTLVSAITDLSVGDIVSVRRHYTLGDLSSSSQIPNDTIISFYVGGVSTSYIFGDGDWYENFGDFNLANNVEIYPGEGFFINVPVATTLTFLGTVSADPIRVVASSPFSLIGLVNPVSESSANHTIGAVFNSVMNDTILSVYSSDGSLSSTSYIFGDGDWYENFGDFNFANSVSIAGLDAVVVAPTSTVEILLPAAY